MTISENVRDVAKMSKLLPAMEVEAVGGKSLVERQDILNRRRAAGWDLITATDIFLYFRQVAQQP